MAQAAYASQVELRHLGDSTPPIDPRGQGKLTTGLRLRAMLHGCRIDEQVTLDRYAADATVYVVSSAPPAIKPVLERYRKLADRSKELVLFAELDEALPLDARLVDVTGCALAREWFPGDPQPKLSSPARRARPSMASVAAARCKAGASAV